MKTLISVVHEHLRDIGFFFTRQPSRCQVPILGDSGRWTLEIITNEDDRWIICRSLLPCTVPARLRRKAVLYVTGCNYRLIFGGFEMGLRNGVVAFKTTLRLSEDELTASMVADLLGCNCAQFDQYLPGFMALLHGRRSLRYCLRLVHKPLYDDVDPEEVLPALENPEEDPWGGPSQN